MAEIQHFDICVFFNKVNILHRNVGAVQVGEGDVLSMLFQPVPDAGAVGFPVENLNAHLFQGRGVGLLMGIVVPQEFHHKALFHKHLHVLVGTFGSGVLVEGGNVVVHHQDDLLAAAALPGPEGVGISSVLVLVFKLFRPLFSELSAVFHLVALQAGAVDVGAVGNSLKVDDLGEGLIHHPVARFSHLKGQVRVLAVGRGVPLVKAADLFPQPHRQHDGGAGNVVHVLHIVVLRLVRVVHPAVVPAGAVAPDDSAGLLKPSIRVYQLGTHHADGLV